MSPWKPSLLAPWVDCLLHLGLSGKRFWAGACRRSCELRVWDKWWIVVYMFLWWCRLQNAVCVAIVKGKPWPWRGILNSSVQAANTFLSRGCHLCCISNLHEWIQQTFKASSDRLQSTTSHLIVSMFWCMQAYVFIIWTVATDSNPIKYVLHVFNIHLHQSQAQIRRPKRTFGPPLPVEPNKPPHCLLPYSILRNMF